MATTPPPEPEEPPVFTHTGRRYHLGYGPDFYGIWDTQAPGGPVDRFPKTERGWEKAWARHQTLELEAAAPPPAAAPAATPPPAVHEPAAATEPARGTPEAVTAPLPAAPPARTMTLNLSDPTIASVLRIGGWAALALFPITGIAILAQRGAGFAGVMLGLSYVAFGVVLWGVSQAVAKILARGR